MIEDWTLKLQLLAKVALKKVWTSANVTTEFYHNECRTVESL